MKSMSVFLVFLGGCLTVSGEIQADVDQIVAVLYNDFKTAGPLPLNIKELRPKRPDDPWQCDVTSAVEGSDPAVFQAELLVDTAFGGRQTRVSLRGKERKDIDGTYGLAVAKNNPGLMGTSAYEVVWRGTNKRTVTVGYEEDPSYGAAVRHLYKTPIRETHSFPVAQVRFGTACLRKLGEEIIIEVAAMYFQVTDEATRDYKNHTSVDLTPHDIALRKEALPSQCFKNTKVEWLLVCQ